MAKAKPLSSLARPEKLSGKESIYTLLPWSCTHYSNHSEIEAYLAATGDREIIAGIYDAAGIDAEHMAGFIVRAVNAYEKHLELIDEMAAAIELCLECEGPLTWAAEQATDTILKRYRQSSR